MTFSLFATALLTMCSIFAQGLQTKPTPNFYSIEKERSLGASQAQELQRRTTALNDAAALDYVRNMGVRLAAQIPHSSFSYTFALIKDDEGGASHEPVALPGGYIFVPAALFLAAQDEAEMAGMLAHAMEHVAARHATREATRAEIAKFTAAPAIFAQPEQQALALAQAAVRRNDESEADRLAVESMHAAGYDPEALASYVARMQPAGNLDPASGLPARDQRLTAIANQIQQLTPQDYAPAGEFSRIQDQVRRTFQ